MAKPTAMAGGGNTYTGFRFLLLLASNANGTSTASVAAQAIAI